jgi:putative transposase
LGDSGNGCKRKRAEHKDHVWSYDFAVDRTEDGRRLKMMPIVDEYSRERLTIEVERSTTSEEGRRKDPSGIIRAVRRAFLYPLGQRP